MKLYKLTDRHDRTHNDTKWGEGVTHTASGDDELCTSAWLHAYTHPLLAVVLNPIHAQFDNPNLWEADGEVGISDGLKVGCTKLTTLKRMDRPNIAPDKRIRFAIYCAKQVYRGRGWNLWADNWLSGRDRSSVSADNIATFETWDTPASRSAAWAAWAARQRSACWSKEIAWAASLAIEASNKVGKTLNFISLIEQAMKDESEAKDER